jgi:hypothetical protein
MNRYLKSLEVWLNDWRMSIAANKCSFTIYSRKIPKMLTNGEFKLEIYGKPIPINHSPRYLGVLIDNHLNLNNHIKNLSEKCFLEMLKLQKLGTVYKSTTYRVQMFNKINNGIRSNNYSIIRTKC